MSQATDQNPMSEIPQDVSTAEAEAEATQPVESVLPSPVEGVSFVFPVQTNQQY